MTDAISAPTVPVVNPEIKKADTGAPKAPAAEVKGTTPQIAQGKPPVESGGTIGAGVGQGTPPEGAAKKLYMTA